MFSVLEISENYSKRLNVLSAVGGPRLLTQQNNKVIVPFQGVKAAAQLQHLHSNSSSFSCKGNTNFNPDSRALLCLKVDGMLM